MDLGEDSSNTSIKQFCTDPVVREFEQCYRALLESNPNAVCIHHEGSIVYANPAALKLAGISRIHEVIGTSIFDFVHSSSKPVIEERIRKMQETGQTPEILELTCIWPNGSTSDVEVISTPVPWHGIPAIQFILHDVTEHKRWERQLAESEQRFHELADSMPQIVWMAGPDGKIDYLNKKFYEQTGLTQEEVNAASDIWKLILHPDDAEATSQNWEDCSKSGDTFEMAYRYRVQKTDAFRWHLGRALPIKDPQGNVVRWFGTCTDIHRQKTTEAELEKAKAALSKATKTLEKKVDSRTSKLNASIKSMEDFCYSIAHNLRAPVRAMQGFSVALLEDYGPVLDQSGHDYISRIHSAATNMDTLILDLLAYGRIDHQDLTLRPIYLHNAMELIIRHHVTETKEVEASFHLAHLNFSINADENMLRHIFVNLFSNAVKFAKPGEKPHIEVSAEEREDMIHISVRDNGIGISPEYQRKIFYAFERLHADDYAGTGIGLAIARKAAERLGGKLGVQSEVNHGSCFWVELPKAAS